MTHVLVLSRNYPNSVFPSLGLWAERLVQAAAPVADCTVVAPVPWAPPLLRLRSAQRFRAVPAAERGVGGVPVIHPRVMALPGTRLHGLDARMQFPSVRAVAEQVHRERPVDLIHAHFIYPEGVMAARLGRRWQVPVVTSEHALWLPWLDQWPAVRRQVVLAAPNIARVLAVSRAVQDTIHAILGPEAHTGLLPNAVDEQVFRAPAPGEHRDTNQILFVGAVRHVKGLDVLVRALAALAHERPALRVLVLGEAFYGQWRRDEDAVKRLCHEVGVADRVIFEGRATPERVAAAMRSSAALVVPGRRESFSAVAIEALASGTPVVATRCGGPEDFLSEVTGTLVPPEDPAALAAGIRSVLDRGEPFDPAALHRIAVTGFGMGVTTSRVEMLYREILAGGGRR